jgi:long-chain acyl-CoA synthetase
MRPWLAEYPTHVAPDLPLPSRSMIDVWEQTVAADPARVAVYHFDRAIRFGEIDERAERFAALLKDWGIGAGDRVAVSLQNDPEFLVAQYGAWKRGAVVVPLSALFKTKEIAYHLQDSGARLWLCRDELFEPQDVERVLTVSELNLALEGRKADRQATRVPVSVDALAYLVYTSGTTGSPKGSMGLHRHIAFNANAIRTWFQVGEGDVIAGIAPLFHITGLVAHLALSALSGAPLILAERFQAAEMMRLMEKWRATMTLAAITAFLAMMREKGERDLRRLTKCGTGGAPVPPAVANEFAERFGVLIHNTYGLTESNSPSHMTPPGRRGPVDAASGALAIGLPVPNAVAKIVDAAEPGRTLAPGETGEIALQGPMMFDGYWRKPEATQQAWHEGFFLTGDIATMDERGWFYIVDRKKDMIVASGFKVWPREVEDVLYQHPAVREAAVVGEPDEYRGETVRAVIALKAGAAASAEEIIAFCRARMAAYKYPRQVEFVEELPKTATGKFLRRALRR